MRVLEHSRNYRNVNQQVRVGFARGRLGRIGLFCVRQKGPVQQEDAETQLVFKMAAIRLSRRVFSLPFVQFRSMSGGYGSGVGKVGSHLSLALPA